MSLQLTILDKQVLFRKYISEGLTGEEADFRLKEICIYLRQFLYKLRKKNKSPEQINQIFLEELARLRLQ